MSNKDILEIRGCLFKDRGDCDHYVGLPKLWNDRYTDEYGRPHGWCEICWCKYQLKELRGKYHNTAEYKMDELTRMMLHFHNGR